jgi:cysteine synthase
MFTRPHKVSDEREKNFSLLVRNKSTIDQNQTAVLNGFMDTIGRTPLIKLERLSKESGCNILVKNEYMNPGGSVKDRAALFLIKDAIRRKMVVHYDTKGAPTPTIVEGK